MSKLSNIQYLHLQIVVDPWTKNASWDSCGLGGQQHLLDGLGS